MSSIAIDVDTALERLDGDLELLVELCEVFLQELPGLLSAVQNAVAAKDAHQIERAAHSLKGAVSNLAAEGALQAAAKLEIMGREENIGEAEDILKTLEAELELVKVAAAELMAKQA